MTLASRIPRGLRADLLLAACGLWACAAGCKAPDASPQPAAASSSSGATKKDTSVSIPGVPGPRAEEKPAPAGPRRLSAEEKAMGTLLSIQVFAPDDSSLPRPAEQSVKEAFAEIHRLEALMSTWIANSEVSAINAHGYERPVVVGPDTFAVLERSRWASDLSHGAFDITFEVMHGLWRFDHDLDGQLPSPEEVAARRSLIDYRAVHLTAARREVRLQHAETKINLGGIAKGYAVDKAVEKLFAGGLRDFIVQAGGDLYAHGNKPDGSPWVVGVRDPRGPEGSFFGSLAVTDHSFSTAGDYERSFFREGQRYHHIIDPRTGYPATACRGVTVWAADALTADAIDDAIFILGPHEGLALCERVEGCGAVIVDAANKVWVSSRLTTLFQQHRPPTEGS